MLTLHLPLLQRANARGRLLIDLGVPIAESDFIMTIFPNVIWERSNAGKSSNENFM